MSDIFRENGIERLSSSSLTSARRNLFKWCLTYGSRHLRDEPNLPMICGSVAEIAIEFGIKNPTATIEECNTKAREEYNRRTTLSGFTEEKRLAKMDDLCGYGTASRSYAGMVSNGVKALRPYGVPSETQVKIETTLAGIPIPIIGFKDFSYDEHGLDIDLKTTTRMPKEMSPDHQLQGAIYWRASNNRSQQFCYTTKSESKVLELDPYAAEMAIKEATAIAHTLKNLLEKFKTVDELTNYIIPDWSNFSWSAHSRAVAMNVWEENLKKSLT